MPIVLRKPLDRITAADIDDFCAHGTPESELLELKGLLPHKKKEVNPWSATNTRLTEFTKREILKEVVALANSYGGHVILGVDETDDDPPRADHPVPIPACGELEVRLEDVFRNAIDPTIVGLELRAVPYPDGANEGVLVIRIPRSRLRPHRSSDRHVYARIGRSSVPLPMREIQDRVLQARTALEQVEKRLDSRRITEPPEVGAGRATAAVRVTVLPTGGDVFLPKPYSFNNSLSYLPERVLRVTIDGKQNYLEIPTRWSSCSSLKPMLRGAVRHYTGIGTYNASVRLYTEEIQEDGLVELVYQKRAAEFFREYIRPITILPLAAHAIMTALRVCQLASAPGTELVIEVQVEFWPLPEDLDAIEYRNPFLGAGSFTLPRIALTGPDFTARLKTIYDDILNYLGRPHSGTFEIDWIEPA